MGRKKKGWLFTRRFPKGVVNRSISIFRETGNFSGSDLSVYLVSTGFGRLSDIQLEAVRRTIRRRFRREVRVELLVETNRILTKKSLQSRMGGGKGKLAGRFSFIRPGQLLIRLTGSNFLRVGRILGSLLNKFSISITFRQVL